MKVKTNFKIRACNTSQTYQSTANEFINAVTLINKSADNFPNINGYTLAYGESISFTCNAEETDKTVYNVTIPDIGTPDCFIIIKFNNYE